jgi:hypothetical protein
MQKYDFFIPDPSAFHELDQPASIILEITITRPILTAAAAKTLPNLSGIPNPNEPQTP